MKKQLKQLMTGAVMVSLMAGCAVGPKYQRPAIKSPPVFRSTANPTVAPDPHSLADLKWFELFKDSHLQELIRTALTDNYDIRDAIARVSAARANLGIARADQFPTIGVSADLTTQRSSRSGALPLPENFSQRRTFGSVLLRGGHLGAAATPDRGGPRSMACY